MFTSTISHDHATPVVAAATTGMSGVRRRFGTLTSAWRDVGPAGLALALAGHLPRPVGHMEWYSVQEVPVGPEHVTEPWPHAWAAGPDDLEALIAVGHASEDELRRRLARRDEVFIACDEAGRGIGYMWYRAGNWREDDVEFVLGPDERWGYDLYVHPDWRGHRVASRLVAVALVGLHARGVSRVISVIDYLNVSSRRSARHYGSRGVTSVFTVASPWAGLIRERRVGASRGSWSAYRRPAGVVRRAPSLTREAR